MGRSDNKTIQTGGQRTAVDRFLRELARVPTVKPAGQRGRLIFAMDATASREPTWHKAAEIQSQMFAAAAALGGLEIQLSYYRGQFDFKASPFLTDGKDMQRLMRSVHCEGGYTQIGRVLEHAQSEAVRQRVNAVVFVGDCMEESPDRLAGLAPVNWGC